MVVGDRAAFPSDREVLGLDDVAAVDTGVVDGDEQFLKDSPIVYPGEPVGHRVLGEREFSLARLAKAAIEVANLVDVFRSIGLDDDRHGS